MYGIEEIEAANPASFNDARYGLNVPSQHKLTKHMKYLGKAKLVYNCQTKLNHCKSSNLPATSLEFLRNIGVLCYTDPAACRAVDTPTTSS